MASVKERSQRQCNAKLFDKVYDPKYEGRLCEVVNDCLNRGADINAVDRNNGCNTVLHEAVAQKSKSLVSFLLDNGARTDIRNEEDFTAFELAKQLKCDDDIIKSFDEYSQHLGFSSNEPIKFVSYSNADLVSMLNAKPKQPVFFIDISGSDSHILLNEDFYKTIERYENLIIFDVFIDEEIAIDCSVVLGHLKSIKNPIIIQYRSPSTAKVYFKEFQRDPGFIELNSQPMEIDQDLVTRLEDEKSFGIRLIIEGFLNHEFGNFRDEGCKILANVNLSQNGFRLLNLAVKHNHLLAVRFLLLYKVPPVLLNYSMKTLSREMLAALLKVELPIPVGKIHLSADVFVQFRQCKDELFKNAAYNGRQDLIEFLLQCTNDMDCKFLIGSFIEKKRYIVALAILKADALFPYDFKSSDINVSIPYGKEFVDFLWKRNHLHDLIVSSTLDNVKEHLDRLFKSKLYLNTNNESAVATALRKNKFDIYGYLWSQGVCFKDDQENQLISQLNYSDKLRLREQMIPFISQIGDSTINYLLSKTRLPLFQLDDARKEQIRRYYDQLNEIPEVTIILAVVQYSDYLDIIFDFDSELTIQLDPMSSNSEGIYHPELGRIYIGAKLDEKRLLGVIAHELTHLAMQLVYSNECKPYFRADIVEELQFNKLVAETSQLTNFHPIIGYVFDPVCYPDHKRRAAELIVRVNHILAMCGLEDGEAVLNDQVPKLLDYYRSQVMKQCQTFICESHLIKMKCDIQHINYESGIIKFINNSNIRFKSQIDLNGFLKSEERILFFSTRNTWQTTTQICQNFKDIQLTESELSQFAFLNLKDLSNFEYESTDSYHVFVLNVSPNFKADQDLNVIADWVNRIFQNTCTKLVLVFSARDESVIRTQLQCHLLSAVEMRSDEHFEIESFLASEKQIFIFKTQHPRLSTIGIYQLLVNWSSSWEKSIVVVNFQDFLKVYRKYHQVLMSDACKMIVLESSKNYDDLPKAMLAQVNNAVVQCGKKLIVVTPGSVDSLLVSDDRIQLSESVHSFSLSDLTVNSSKSLLDRDVKFLGELVKLSEIIKEIYSSDVIDAETIVKLTNEEAITVGKEMPIDEVFYVPRTLSCRAQISGEWVKKHLKNKNLSTDIAVCLHDDERFQLAEMDGANENHFHELCNRHPEMDIHWLKRRNGEYVWKKSKSTPTGFKKSKKYIDMESADVLNEDGLVDELDEHQLVIVSDNAGMGKTALVTHMAQLIKDKHPTKWIVKVNLNMYTKVLDEEAKNSSFRSDEVDKALYYFVNKLLESRSENKLETDFEKQLIRQCIRHYGDVVILFDAFDELKSKQQQVIIKLIKSLQKTKVKQMWVTTRPHRKNLLENEFQQLSFTIDPFTKKDQLDFLIKFWVQKLNVNETVGTFTEYLLTHFADQIGNVKSTKKAFTQIPLQTKMLAEAFESECCLYRDWTDEQLKSPKAWETLRTGLENFDMDDLYGRFTKSKLDIYQLHKPGLDESTLQADLLKSHYYPLLLEMHRLLAVFAIFNKKDRAIIFGKDEVIKNIDEFAGDLFSYGIIDEIVNGKPHFIHKTFAEYFTAEFIVGELLFEKRDADFIRFVYDKIFIQDNFKVVRVFIEMGLKKINYTSDIYHSLSQQMKSTLRKYKLKLMKLLTKVKKECNMNIAKLMFSSLKGYRGRAFDVNCVKSSALFFDAINVRHSDLIEVMLQSGFAINGVFSEDDENDDNFECWGCRTSLCEAVTIGHEDICRLLLANGANRNSRVFRIPAILSGSKLVNCTVLHVACLYNRPNVLSVLLEYNADVNATDKNRVTPFHVAAYRGWIDIVDILVDHNADINAVCAEGYTPLYNAIKRKKADVVAYIVQLNGHDINATNGTGVTPLHIAAIYGDREIIRTLIDHGADINAVMDLNQIARTPQCVTKFIRATTSYAPVTPLYLARVSGNHIAVAILLQRGADDKVEVEKCTFRQVLERRNICWPSNSRFVAESEEWVWPNGKYFIPFKD